MESGYYLKEILGKKKDRNDSRSISALHLPMKNKPYEKGINHYPKVMPSAKNVIFYL
jgi:hypothetical protein